MNGLNAAALVGFFAASVPFAASAQQSVASQETSIPGGTLMVIAYVVFTTMMLGYLALLSWRQRRLDEDIEELEKRLDELAALD
jgi:hypothetical protein